MHHLFSFLSYCEARSTNKPHSCHCLTHPLIQCLTYLENRLSCLSHFMVPSSITWKPLPVSLLLDNLSILNNGFLQTTAKRDCVIAMSHSSIRKHRRYHSKALIKAAVQPSAKTPLSPSRTPRAASTTPMPSPPSTVLTTPTTITVDHAPAPTMQPATPHNMFALPSTSPAQLPPQTILAILLLIIVLTTAAI